MLSHQPRYLSSFLVPYGSERRQGEGEGRQVCATAPALTPVLPVSIAAKRSRRCSPPFPEPFWRCPCLAQDVSSHSRRDEGR